MRLIKFRAWHEKVQRMFTAEEMAADQLTLLPTGKFINVSGVSTAHSIIYDCMIPMQYTGKKDKNGIEIYEGDWCRACFRDAEGIHFKQGKIIMDEYMWCLDTMDEADKDGIYSINRLHDWEVLGNIYEHADKFNLETITQ